MMPTNPQTQNPMTDQEKITELTRERDELREKLAGANRRMYPIWDGPGVPYEVMIPHEAQCKTNRAQSIDRMAERGGFCCAEAWCVVSGVRWSQMENTIGQQKAKAQWIAFAERVNLHYAELEEIRSIVAEFGYPRGTTAENLRKHIAYTTGEIKRLREGEKRAEAYMAKLQAMIPIERRVELAKEMEGNWVALMARKG